jgi:hypothetical protein
MFGTHTVVSKLQNTNSLTTHQLNELTLLRSETLQTRQLYIIAIVIVCTHRSNENQNLYRKSNSSHPAGTQSPTD